VCFGLRTFAGTPHSIPAATETARCVGQKTKGKKDCRAQSKAAPAREEEELAGANCAAHDRILCLMATKTDGARG